MPRWKKYSLISVGVILALLLLTMLIVPWQIKQQGSRWFDENTSRQLSIENAFFNPFTLSIEIEGLVLTEQNSTETFASFQRLMLSGSARSLLNLAFILDRVELEQPFVNIELLGKQEFNFSDLTRLGENPPQPESQEPDEPLHFSLNNIVITDGGLDFTDRTSEKSSRHEIREFTLAVPFIGNIPYLTDDYVEPKLRLLLNGSEILATGQLKPFAESLETRLNLLLDDIDLAYYAYHSPVPLPVEVKQGVLDIHLDLAYRISSNDQPKLLLGGELALSNIDLREPDGRELAKLETLILDLDWANLMQRDFNLLALDVYQPEVFIHRNGQGLWNFQRLFPAQGRTEAAEEEASEPAAAQLPLIKADKISLTDGLIHYQDDYPPGGFSEEVTGITLQLEDFSTHRGELTALDFELQTARELSLSIDGQLGVQPLSAELSLLLNGLQLKPHYPYLADLLTEPLAGSLNLASQLRYDEANQFRLQQAQLGLHQLLVPFGGDDRFTLDDLSVTGASFDLQQQQLTIGAIKLAGGDLTATRRADGSLTPLDLLRSKPEKAAEPTPQTAETVELPWQKQAKQVETDGLKVALKTFDLERFKLQFTDASLSKKPQVKVEQLNLNLQDLSYPEAGQSPFKLSGKVGKRGSFAFTGKLRHTPLQIQASSRIDALSLAEYNDFLPAGLNLQLKDGKLASNLAIELRQQTEGFSGGLSGQLNLSDFSLFDPLGQGELLAWERLELKGLKAEIAPFRLRIDEVALSNYLAKIQIDEEGRVNLNRVTEDQAEPEKAAASAAEPEPLVEQEVTEELPPDIQVAAVTLQGGTVSFIDRHLRRPFSTTMYKLGGRVTGLSSDESMRADVDLRGELENHSPLTISGELNPLSKDLYADLTISFKDIDLAPMSPYSGTYLGYLIDKGKLYLDLNYHIENQHINASNKVLIDQFNFGDSVKSDRATSLPVTLAVALLKDRDGEIHLDVPIAGDLNDPSFSIGGTILTILKNLLVKAATSPFTLLTSMFGGAEDFSSIDFPPGVARLTEEQRDKLNKLAEMLVKRPSLTLDISAYVDPENDPEGYRQNLLQQRVREAKWRELQEDGQAPASPEEIEVSAEEYPEYLTEIYENADFPRPRNFIGLLKELPVAEMEKLLLANIRADQEQLQELANARARAVRDQLIATEEAIKPRIFLTANDIDQPAKKGVASRVEFAISSK